jgi:hypothetical protein
MKLLKAILRNDLFIIVAMFLAFGLICSLAANYLPGGYEAMG